MSGSTGSRSVARFLVAIQVFLLVASFFAPVASLAAEPSDDPGATPSAEPSAEPTPEPTPEPTAEPTPEPTVEPTPEPTAEPTPEPTAEPTPEPTAEPTPEPTADPTPEPTAVPTQEPAPTYAPSGPASIVSDAADYPPGATVTLTGWNWFAGEDVHIFVNDDSGASWTHSADVVAGALGHVSYSFTLPNWFVATYSVVATGAQSGTATTTFTDGNFTVKTNSSTILSSLTWVEHDDNLNCTAPIADRTSGSVSSFGSANGNDFSGGVASSHSLFVTVADLANGGEPFTGWSPSTLANPYIAQAYRTRSASQATSRATGITSRTTSSRSTAPPRRTSTTTHQV